MINPDDHLIPSLRTSLAENEIVLRLIGWLRGPLQKGFIQITEKGISIEELPFVNNPNQSLEETLGEVRRVARDSLLEAIKEDTSPETIEKLDASLVEVDALISRAWSFALDLNEEINRRVESTLILDTQETQKSGVNHYTVRSVDRWAQEKYKISVINENPVQNPNPASVSETPSHDDQLGADGPATEKSVESLLITLALFVEHFAESQSKYSIDGKPNSLQIATYFATKTSIYGQKSESIRHRISAALNAKERKLRTM